jgi:rubrerythrin
MNIFDCAIKMEEEARSTYEKMAAATDVTELKNLFTLLAQSEQEHYDTLTAMKKNPDLKQVQFKALEDMPCLITPLLALRDLMDGQPLEGDVYQQVIREEDNGVMFYEDLAAQTEDEQTREILLRIAEEERRHLSIVENIYAFVESPKNFLAWGEFSNLKEY